MIYNSLTDTLRKILWVIGRRLYLWSRNELTNNPATNGEYSLLTKILKIKNNNCEIVMIDIGANIGEWTNQVLLHLKNNHNHNPNTKVVVFEPAIDTFNTLKRNLSYHDNVIFNNALVSNYVGTSDFYIHDKNSKTNSIFIRKGKRVSVKSTTIDQYVVDCNINYINYIKCDTEGNDFNVILGAEKSLDSEIIAMFQFEYNHRWINAKCFLKDVFDFIDDKNYFLGKITRNTIEIYQNWHPEMERFFEANYILINKNQTEIIATSKFVTFGRRNVISYDALN
jgi:FkbM family methyltransferase